MCRKSLCDRKLQKTERNQTYFKSTPIISGPAVSWMWFFRNTVTFIPEKQTGVFVKSSPATAHKFAVWLIMLLIWHSFLTSDDLMLEKEREKLSLSFSRPALSIFVTTAGLLSRWRRPCSSVYLFWKSDPGAVQDMSIMCWFDWLFKPWNVLGLCFDWLLQRDSVPVVFAVSLSRAEVNLKDQLTIHISWASTSQRTNVKLNLDQSHWTFCIFPTDAYIVWPVTSFFLTYFPNFIHRTTYCLSVTEKGSYSQVSFLKAKWDF